MAKLAGVQLGPGARLLVCSLRWPERRTCPPPSHPQAGKKAWALGVWISASGEGSPGMRPLVRLQAIVPQLGQLGRLWVPRPRGLEWRLQGGQARLPGHFPLGPCVACPSTPAPSGLSCSVPAYPRHCGASRKSASTPGHGPRLFPQGGAPRVPTAARGPSSGCCSELCMSALQLLLGSVRRLG